MKSRSSCRQAVHLVEDRDVPLAAAASTTASVTLAADDDRLPNDEENDGYGEDADDGAVKVRHRDGGGRRVGATDGRLDGRLNRAVVMSTSYSCILEHRVVNETGNVDVVHEVSSNEPVVSAT